MDRTVGYCRYSTPKQDGGVTIEAQELHIKKLVDEKGWLYTKTYADEHVSGAVIASDRAGLSELLDDAKAKLFDRMVTYDASRLARDQNIFWNIVTELKQLQVIYLTVVMPEIDSTKAEFELVAGTLQGMASYERQMVSRKTKDALAILKVKGKVRGRPMFGFVINEQGYFEPDKLGAQAIDLVRSNPKASAKNLMQQFDLDYYKAWSLLKNAKIYNRTAMHYQAV